MSALMARRGVWDRDGGALSLAVGLCVGDRVFRLSNGRAVGTVVAVDDDGIGFTVRLDEPDNRQWDKNRGLLHYEGLAERGLYVGCSNLVGYGGRRGAEELADDEADEEEAAGFLGGAMSLFG